MESPALDHLKPETQAWIHDLLREYTFEPVQIRLLILAAEAWDRTADARAMIDADGAVIRDRFDQLRPHPAIKIENDSRLAFSKLMRQLKLDLDPPEH